MPSLRYYKMRARDLSCVPLDPPTWRTWVVPEVPDFTAARYEGSYCGGSVSFDNFSVADTWVEMQDDQWIDPVRAATVAPLPANSRSGNKLVATAHGVLPAIDTTVTLVVGDRLLVQDEVAGENNGVYDVLVEGTPDPGGTSWELERSEDQNTSAQVLCGVTTQVSEGTANGGKAFRIATPNPIVLNVTALAWTQSGGPPPSLVNTVDSGVVSPFGVTQNLVYCSDGATPGGSWRSYLALGPAPAASGDIRLGTTVAGWAINCLDGEAVPVLLPVLSGSGASSVETLTIGDAGWYQTDVRSGMWFTLSLASVAYVSISANSYTFGINSAGQTMVLGRDSSVGSPGYTTATIRGGDHRNAGAKGTHVVVRPGKGNTEAEDGNFELQVGDARKRVFIGPLAPIELWNSDGTVKVGEVGDVYWLLGAAHTAPSSDYVTLLGYSAVSRYHGEIAHSVGRYPQSGHVQFSGSTSGAVTEQLFLDGVSELMGVPANASMTLSCLVTAKRDGGAEWASWHVFLSCTRDGLGNAQLGGAPVKTVIYKASAAWDINASVTAGGTNDVVFEGVGEAGMDIEWGVSVDFVVLQIPT